jgi:hypothetical protein
MRPQNVTEWRPEIDNYQTDFHDDDRTCQPTITKTIMKAVKVGENFGNQWHVKIQKYSVILWMSFGWYITRPSGVQQTVS